MTAVSFDAFGGAEAFAVVGVAHAGVAVTFAGWSHKEKHETSLKRHTPHTHPPTHPPTHRRSGTSESGAFDGVTG